MTRLCEHSDSDSEVRFWILNPMTSFVVEILRGWYKSVQLDETSNNNLQATRNKCKQIFDGPSKLTITIGEANLSLDCHGGSFWGRQ